MVNDKISEQDGMFDGNRDPYFSVGQSAGHGMEVARLAASPLASAGPGGVGRLCVHDYVNRFLAKAGCDEGHAPGSK
jgi:hypothetical protein